MRLEVDPQRRQEVVEQLARTAPRAHGCANSKRCVTSWIATNVRKSVGSSDQSASNARDVRDDEHHGPWSRPRHGHVVLPQHPLREEAERPGRPGRPSAAGESCASMPLIACSSAGQLGPAARRAARGRSTRRSGRRPAPAAREVLGVRADPRRAPDGAAPRDVGGGLEAGEARDVQLRDAHGSSNAVPILVGRLGVVAAFRGARDRHLSGELPVDRARRGRTSRAASRGTAARRERLRIHAEREPEPACLVAHAGHRTTAAPAFVTMAAWSDREPTSVSTRAADPRAGRPAVARRGRWRGRRPRRRRHLRLHRHGARPLRRRRVTG